MKACILIIDSDKGIQYSFTQFLQRSEYRVECAGSLSEADHWLGRVSFDAIVLDHLLPDGDGIGYIRRLRRDGATVPLIFITAEGNTGLAIEAMQSGADIYLDKPIRFGELAIFLEKSFEIGRMRSKLRSVQRQRREAKPFWGDNQSIRETRRLAKLAAGDDVTVLLQGETGTGKGLLAQWLHDHSTRARNAFVSVNCAGLKGDLLASELFGHARGAFTTAVNEKPGLVEVADGGTLFLDEISSMNLQVQSELIKVIEERVFRRVGETRVRTSNFRLICADNRDLTQAASNGGFRHDLLFRLNVFPIHMPPLRRQIDDLSGYLRHLLDELGAANHEIEDEVYTMLREYHWPGNVRELRNVLERALILSGGEPLCRRHFPGLAQSPGCEATPSLADNEKRFVLQVMSECNDDTRLAAARLGVSRQSLYRRLKRYRETR
ncbi:MAG: sigma-54 dependent transcriptional regulator [Candidatus Cloacimonetes bacterium]|nr:sigma-54 dependent transcriptional regulator [Candidatus Cloacimonadota bacterium]